MGLIVLKDLLEIIDPNKLNHVFLTTQMPKPSFQPALHQEETNDGMYFKDDFILVNIFCSNI